MPWKDKEKQRTANRVRMQKRRAGEHVQRYGEGAGNMQGKHKNHARGADHPRWEEFGVYKDVHGYFRLRVGVGHPLADPRGYVYLHLIVWVAAGNQKPDDDHALHHKDEDKSNNRIENLELLTNSEHAKLHDKQRGRTNGKFKKKQA
jgi:hypothetical protein